MKRLKQQALRRPIKNNGRYSPAVLKIAQEKRLI